MNLPDRALGVWRVIEDPATGYDLLRTPDGTPSGFAIQQISPAGAMMAGNITVPW